MVRISWIPVNLIGSIMKVNEIQNNKGKFLLLFLGSSILLGWSASKYVGLHIEIIRNFLVILGILFGFSVNASILLWGKLDEKNLDSDAEEIKAFLDTWHITIFSIGLGFIFMLISLLYYLALPHIQISMILSTFYYSTGIIYIFSVGMLVRYIPSLVGVELEN